MFLNLTFTAFLIAICHTLYIFVYKLERQEQAFLPISQYDSTHKIDKWGTQYHKERIMSASRTAVSASSLGASFGFHATMNLTDADLTR